MTPKTGAISPETLDFLRGVAAVYVVINHTRGAFFKGGKAIMAEAGSAPLTIFDYVSLAILQLTSLGAEFVILFFCVSGMAMAHSISRAPNPIQFYKKRVIRIWPSYVAAVGLAVVVCYSMVSTNSDNLISVACHTKLCDLGHVAKMIFYIEPHSTLTPQFWSLPYEVIFYIVCPIILYSKSSVLWSLASSIFLAIIGSIWFGIGLNPSDSVLINFFINALLWFMCGAAGYLFYDRIPRFRPVVFWMLSALLLGFVLGTKLMVGYSNIVSNIAMILLTLVAVRNLPARLTGVKFLNWGEASYSIYLFHYAIIGLISFILLELFSVNAREISSYFLWIVFLPLILASCIVLYFFTERPCNNYLKQLRTTESRKLAVER